MNWLDETETELDELARETGNDPERIKQRLAKHREFQRLLSGKQSTYDATMKAGKVGGCLKRIFFNVPRFIVLIDY